jgi:hypothetical protein
VTSRMIAEFVNRRNVKTADRKTGPGCLSVAICDPRL